MIQADSEILRIEKRIRGLNRVTSAINDLSIYGIFYGNYPELVKVLEHAKDHVKEELQLLEIIERDHKELNGKLRTELAEMKIANKKLEDKVLEFTRPTKRRIDDL